jgi:hypothetical protein
MNPPASLAATVTTSESLQSVQSARPIVPWVFLAVAVLMACTVLVLDSSLTTEQRIALFVQSGMFP